MNLMCPIVIKKNQNKMKAMSNELSLQLQLVRENLDRILKEKISIKINYSFLETLQSLNLQFY